MIDAWENCINVSEQGSLEWSMLPLGFVTYKGLVTKDTYDLMKALYQKMLQDPAVTTLKVNWTIYCACLPVAKSMDPSKVIYWNIRTSNTCHCDHSCDTIPPCSICEKFCTGMYADVKNRKACVQCTQAKRNAVLVEVDPAFKPFLQNISYEELSIQVGTQFDLSCCVQ